MDWEYLNDEILEILDNHGCHEGTISNITRLVERFITSLTTKYNPEAEEQVDELEEYGVNSSW